jgi:hypothetical protein
VSRSTAKGRELLRTARTGKFQDTSGLIYSWDEPVDPPAHSSLPVFGRSRCMWNTALDEPGTEALQAVAWNDLIHAVLSTYSEQMAETTYVICEELIPSLEGQEWHVDRWDEQIKAMVLLVDVDMENGPLILRRGTHRNRPWEVWKLLHEFHCLGGAYSYMSREIVKRLPGEIVYGTGKAGDVIFFDTLAIHSGTRCLSRERLDFVVYPIANSYKVRALKAVLGG